MIGIAILAAASVASAPPAPKLSCPGENTLEINDCQAVRLAAAEGELERYLAAARRRLKADAEGDAGVAKALAGFDRIQAAWRAYRDAECDALYDYWSSGTIRTSIELTCKIDLTRERTHAVWSDWLTYMDSTPPILPEPKVESGAPFAN
ncbi:MAG TPA: lysozyme inhibitor LprI family protein [Caulobacteraceae bacterium]|nr:lysozyme inhibitor LprI family protein [Caulobacteraceae bacterium]